MAGKATVVHRRDMQKAIINLCCKPQGIEMRDQMFALRSFGVEDLAHVLLSRDIVPFIDAMCVDMGIVGEPVFFRHNESRKQGRPAL
jgi:hypothetical protein